MKEWSNKPTDLVKISSSPVKTVSSSPVGSAGSSIVKTSGSVVKTSGASMTLTSGNSTTIASTSSSGTVGTNLTHRAAIGAVAVTPLAAGTVVGGIAAVFYGVGSIIKYREHKKTGAQAAKDTVKNSAGLGVSAGFGVAAAHAVAGTAFALGNTIVVPLIAGVATVYISMKIWDKIFPREKEASKTG